MLPRLRVSHFALPVLLAGLAACAALEQYTTQPKPPPRHDDEPVVGPPAKLVFINQPLGGLASEPVSPQPIVSIRDANDQVVVTATNAVTLRIFSNKNAAYTSPTGFTTHAQGGTVAFPEIRIPAVGDGFTLTVESPGLVGATSWPFAVHAGPPAVLAIPAGGFPSRALAGTPFNLFVAVRDRNGYATPWSVPVTLALEDAPRATLTGPTTLALDGAGSGTFKGLSIDVAGTGYVLRVSSHGLPDNVLRFDVQ